MNTVSFLWEFLKKGEISPRWASPPNRASSLVKSTDKSLQSSKTAIHEGNWHGMTILINILALVTRINTNNVKYHQNSMNLKEYISCMKESLGFPQFDIEMCSIHSCHSLKIVLLSAWWYIVCLKAFNLFQANVPSLPSNFKLSTSYKKGVSKSPRALTHLMSMLHF